MGVSLMAFLRACGKYNAEIYGGDFVGFRGKSN